MGLVGGFSGPSPLATPTVVTDAMSRGRCPGAVRWSMRLRFTSERRPLDVGSWESRLEVFRVTDTILVKAQRVWYGCRQSEGVGDATPSCSDARCPKCWDQPAPQAGSFKYLQHLSVECSRFGHGVSRQASSGSGRFKGGNVRSATGPVVKNSAGIEIVDSAGGRSAKNSKGWALEEGEGEDIESYTTPVARRDAFVGIGSLTIGRILYFFEHTRNNTRGLHGSTF